MATKRDSNTETPRARFERIKGEVLLLTAKQRAEIVSLLGVCTDDATPTTRAAGTDDSNMALVYGAVASAIEVMVAVPSSAAPFRVAMTTMSADIRKATAACDLLLAHHTTDALRKVERTGLYHTCARIVLAHMRRTSIPITMRTLMQQLANVASIMDDAFPGYANAGLLRVVLERTVHAGGVITLRP
jgi:hypothetical protein